MMLAEAEKVGMEVVEALAGGCERIMIAGSVRRGKREPKDIEIVFIAALVDAQIDLFTRGLVSSFEGRLDRVVDDGLLAWDEEVVRRGPKYRRLVHVATGMVVELFRAERANWGLILALRTGPGDFNKLLVTRSWDGGAMVADMKMEGGYLWRRGMRMETATEETFFAALGLPCWEPGERTVKRLREGLKDRKGMWLLGGEG